MGKLEGMIKWQGKLDNLIAYKLNGKWVVRTKGRISKNRYENDPNYKRVRESNKEFGGASKIAAYMRNPWNTLIKKDKDSSAHNRLTKQILARIQNGEGPRGKRTFTWNNAVDQLTNIPLTKSGRIDNWIIGKVITQLDQNQFNVSFENIQLSRLPEGATHYQLITQFDQVHNFTFNNNNYIPEGEQREQHFIETPIVEINQSINEIESLTHNSQGASWTQVTGIKFYQKVNNNYYQLQALPCELTQLVFGS